MRGLDPRARARAVAAATVMVAVLLVGGLVPTATAQTPDRSDVVLEYDFSASILQDAATRNRFAAALDRIAARVDLISNDLIAGDTTMSILWFATRAADYPGCVDIQLLNSPDNVGHFADCLRFVAAQYRKGLTTARTKALGVDTNYVAAMQQAAKHLPANAERPAVILFTDGKHDVKGVPASLVQPTRDRLFGARTPFALLPVGMGIDPKQRRALTDGLERLRITRDMPPCVSGATFDWPTVSFDSADRAGNAVAVALQDATCTFTVAPTPTPPPAPTPAAVSNIHLTAGDARIELAWTPAAATAGSAGASAPPATGYQARCRPQGGSGDWVVSAASGTKATAVIEGLTNGQAYECEVSAVGATNTGDWTAASDTATPVGRPATPPKPTVEGLNAAVRIAEPAGAPGVDRYLYECSADNGATWPATVDAAAEDPSTELTDLTNGTEYVCRASAKNAVGVSDVSPVSDSVRPCGSALQCNPLILPIVGGITAVLLGAILLMMLAVIRGRPKGHVVAVVDVVHTANVGHGSKLGIAFTRGPDHRTVTSIVADTGRKAEVRISRLRGDRFEVRDRVGKHMVADGDAVVIIDGVGVRHSLVLRAFATNAASEVARGR